MPKHYWLVKQEPTMYSFDRLVHDKKVTWDGVRNPQARNNLAAMRKGDEVLFYHSNVGLEVVGVCEVSRESFPDPTADDPRWLAVELAPKKKLARGIPLTEIRSDPALKEIALIRQSRLSVMPLTKAEFDRIVKLGAKRA